MVNKVKQLFESDLGKKIYSSIEKTIFAHNMLERIKSGVLIGLSGGADSVMLMITLCALRDKIGDFPILAVHVNHMIRGLEADRDEEFSCNIAECMGVSFVSEKIDVPCIAKLKCLSIEEAARDVRYSIFSKILSSRNDISTIAVAHNATDNVETVIFNILRGAGTKGAAGIPPVRENIIRPLINISKSDIVLALDSVGIEYVTDSSNFENDYSRNYIRNNILPLLTNISLHPEKSISRLSDNLRLDDEYISKEAQLFISGRKKIATKELASLHPSLLYRVINKMVDSYSVTLEYKHIEIIASLLEGDNFEVSLPGELCFVSERGISYIKVRSNSDPSYIYHLTKGKNDIPEYKSTFYITDQKIDKTSLKVYKNSIQADISSAIIVGSLFVRPKRDGDTVFYNGMTHKLKKLFNDKKIPKSQRPYIPILCDNKGVVWVPGFGVRDDKSNCGSQNNLYVTLAVGCSDADDDTFYIVKNE